MKKMIYDVVGYNYNTLEIKVFKSSSRNARKHLRENNLNEVSVSLNGKLVSRAMTYEDFVISGAYRKEV